MIKRVDQNEIQKAMQQKSTSVPDKTLQTALTLNAQKEGLTEALKIAKTAQKEQVKKARAETKAPQTSLARVNPALPDTLITTAKVTGESAIKKIGDLPEGSILQKLLAPMIQEELKTFPQLIKILEDNLQGKKGASVKKERRELNHMKKELATISKQYPSLTEASIKQLNAMIGQLNNMAENLPFASNKSAYWDVETKMYADLTADAGSAINGLKSMIAYIESLKKDGIPDVANDLKVIASIFLKMSTNTPLSTSDMDSLTAAFTNLLQLSDVVQAGGTKEMDSFLSMIFHVVGGNMPNVTPNSSLYQLMIRVMQNQILNEYMAVTPPGQQTPQGLDAFAQQFIQQNFPASDSTTLQTITNALLHTSENIPDSSGGATFASYDPTTKTYTVNPNWETTALKAFSAIPPSFDGEGTVSSWSDLSKLAAQVATDFAANAPNGLTAKEAVYENAVKKMVVYEKMFRAAAEISKGKSDGYDSLADMIKNDVLDKYMPNQEAYLQALAQELQFSNYGNSLENTFLTTMLGFAESANNYGLSELMHGKSPGIFSGSASDVNTQINQEISQSNKDLTALSKLKSQVTAARTALQNDKEWDNNPNTAQAKQDMLKKLDGYLSQITAAQGQVSKLNTLLKSMTAVAVPGQPTEFFIAQNPAPGSPPLPSTWQTDLTSDESQAVNGVTTGTPPNTVTTGGLAQFNSIVTGDQQNYQNQSQSQQMDLQMKMTEIQQEWTIVSTVLSLLNQDYMVLAQGIYK
ncbi:MAG: CT620/CT621 family type III secretion system effector [Chlamydiales bacterium]